MMMMMMISIRNFPRRGMKIPMNTPQQIKAKLPASQWRRPLPLRFPLGLVDKSPEWGCWFVNHPKLRDRPTWRAWCFLLENSDCINVKCSLYIYILNNWCYHPSTANSQKLRSLSKPFFTIIFRTSTVPPCSAIHPESHCQLHHMYNQDWVNPRMKSCRKRKALLLNLV